MNMNTQIAIRDAKRSDALVLAKLIDIAGEGIPNWLWGQSCKTGNTPLEVGVNRAQRKEGGFSFTNALIAELDGSARGMILSYPIENIPEEAPDDLPSPIAPFVELERGSVDTWYINALAVFSETRGQGIGSKLICRAEEKAQHCGYDAASIQVYSQNTGALRLYEELGYKEAARAKVIEHPCQPYYDEDVVLLIKSLQD